MEDSSRLLTDPVTGNTGRKTAAVSRPEGNLPADGDKKPGVKP